MTDNIWYLSAFPLTPLTCHASPAHTWAPQCCRWSPPSLPSGASIGCIPIQGLRPLKDLALAAFGGVTIYVTQGCESDNLRHAMLQRILESGRPRRIVAVHPPKRGKRRRSLRIGTAVMLLAFKCGLWRMQTLNWDTAKVRLASCMANWAN